MVVKAVIKPEGKRRSYVNVRDAGNKSNQVNTTIYGLTPQQVLEALRIGIEELNRREKAA